MKIFILMIFLVSTIFANDVHLASSIFNTIIHAVVKKEKINVFLHTSVKSLEKYPDKLSIVFDCDKADIVILSTLKEIPKECKGKIMFATKYSQLKNKDVIGAFFWQKGRPNILFYKKRLQEHHIKLDASFDKYIE